VQEYQGRPFALVGVNNDRQLEDAIKEVKENKLNWRSFFDGDQKLAEEFQVNGWPTIVLIDPDGVIQYEYEMDVDKLDVKLAEMVTAAEKKAAE
jgi:hypothetical protein